MSVDPQESERQQVFSRRAILFGILQGGLFTVLLARLTSLQVLHSREYILRAEENRIGSRLLAPPRGLIVDRHGRLIATNRQNFRIVLIPEQTPDMEKTLRDLARFVYISPRRWEVLRRDARRVPGYTPLTVAENLSWHEFARVNVHEPSLPGIQPEVGETRHYLYGEASAHPVGYVAPVMSRDLRREGEDPLLRIPGFRVGRSSVEKVFDRPLRGQAGSARVEVNAYGRVIRELARTPGKQGETLHMTLDMELQDYAMARMQEHSGSCVLMDAHSGDILVMASQPSFDANHFNVGMSSRTWKSLLGDERKPLLNKAIAGLYAPGSVFKLIVALAVLQGGIDPDETISCGGYRYYYDRNFHCWEERGHGRVNLREAMKRSCDIYFYERAHQIGLKSIVRVARAFGLGESHGLESIGARGGNIPQRGGKGVALMTGIGQGNLLATPLQLAVMTAAIANGGFLVMPRLVSAVGAQIQKGVSPRAVGVSRDHLRTVREAMEAVCNEPGGTAYESRLDTARLAGKTGTAQVKGITAEERKKSVLENEERPWRHRDHALFAAFAPADVPRYAISVVIEHGGSGSQVAAPVARDILARLFPRA